MDYFSSIWFKLSLVIVAFLFIYGIVAYFIVSGKRAGLLPVEEKARLTNILPKAVLVCKLVIFLLPLYLIVIPPIYKLDVQVYYQILAGLTVMYAGSILGFLLCRRLLIALR
jgi:hypothetical protein